MRRATGGGSGSGPPGGASPSAKETASQTRATSASNASGARSPTATSVQGRRRYRPAVKVGHLGRSQGAQRGVGPDGRVAVWMRAVQGFQEHPVGQGRGRAPQLPDAVDPQVAHAGDVGRIEAGAHGELEQ